MRPISSALSAALFLFVPPALAQGLPVNCTPERCEVLITMSAGCGSGIKVAPDPIVAPAKAKVTITWKIASPNWSFPSNGIFIHQAGKSFGAGPSGGGLTFNATKEIIPPGTFKYDVNLKDEQGRLCKLDPTIVNQ